MQGDSATSAAKLAPSLRNAWPCLERHDPGGQGLGGSAASIPRPWT